MNVRTCEDFQYLLECIKYIRFLSHNNEWIIFHLISMGKIIRLFLRYDTIEGFNVGSKAEYSALSCIRS